MGQLSKEQSRRRHCLRVVLILAVGASDVALGCGGTTKGSGNEPSATPCAHLLLADPILSLPLKYTFVGTPELIQAGDPNTIVLRYVTQGYDAGSNDLQQTCRYQFLSPWGAWNTVQVTPADDPREGCDGLATGAAGMSFEELELGGLLRNVAAGQPIGTPIETTPGGTGVFSTFLITTKAGFLIGDTHDFTNCPANPPDWTCSVNKTTYLHVREVSTGGLVTTPGDQIIGCGSGPVNALSVQDGELIAMSSARSFGDCPLDDQFLYDASNVRVVWRQLSGALQETAIINEHPEWLRLVGRSDGAWLSYNTLVARLDANGRLGSAPVPLPLGGGLNRPTSLTALGNRLVVTDGTTIDLLDDNAQLVEAVTVVPHDARVTLLGSPFGDSVLAVMAVSSSTGVGEVQLARYDCAP